MIDPIHNQAYQEYSRVSGQKSANGNGEKFSLDVSTDASTDPSLNENTSDHSKDGVIYEPGNRSETTNKESASGKQTGYGNTSSNSNSLSTQPRNTGRNHTGSMESLTDTVRRFLQTALEAVKKFFVAIWESKPKEDEPPSDTDSTLEMEQNPDSNPVLEMEQSPDSNPVLEMEQSPDSNPVLEMEQSPDTDPIAELEKILEADTLDQDIRKALKAGDTDTFRALLSQDGSRLPARSTSLLTYYDASGRLVMPDPSDQHRILHGDRGSQKS